MRLSQIRLCPQARNYGFYCDIIDGLSSHCYTYRNAATVDKMTVVYRLWPLSFARILPTDSGVNLPVANQSVSIFHMVGIPVWQVKI